MGWVGLGTALYLLLGLWLAFKGRLAFRVDTQITLIDMQGPILQWKKVALKLFLRIGIMLFYPVFLL